MRSRIWSFGWRHPSPRETRWDAELLLPGRRMSFLTLQGLPRDVAASGEGSLSFPDLWIEKLRSVTGEPKVANRRPALSCSRCRISDKIVSMAVTRSSAALLNCLGLDLPKRLRMPDVTAEV